MSAADSEQNKLSMFTAAKSNFTIKTRNASESFEYISVYILNTFSTTLGISLTITVVYHKYACTVVRFPARARNFSLGTARPPIQWVLGALSQRVKRPRCEVDHSPPYSAEFNNEWRYTSAPPYAFMVYTLTTLILLYPSTLANVFFFFG
jgi:hypothetical protein